MHYYLNTNPVCSYIHSRCDIVNLFVDSNVCGFRETKALSPFYVHVYLFIVNMDVFVTNMPEITFT